MKCQPKRQICEQNVLIKQSYRIG